MSTQLKILFFGKSRELVGKKQGLLEVPHKISYENLIALIIKEYSLQLISNNLILAINEEYCQQEETYYLKPSDEIAVIPPLSGG